MPITLQDVFSRAPGARILLLWVTLVSAPCSLARASELPSWSEGDNRTEILQFVARVTRKDSPDYVEPALRIAVFDNDGTLWAEQPIYFQFAFALDRIKALAPKHPEWRSTQPFKAVLDGDHAALQTQGERGVMQLMAASHAGITTDEFSTIVSNWLVTARHPQLRSRYTDLVYQPMLELLDFLRTNGFKTFIVSGGGVEFMRVFAEDAYGIPPEQVVGSSAATKFQANGTDGRPVLIKEAKVEFVDDGPGKPSGINRFIGRRPIVAFGNSDGDREMLQWTAAGPGARLIGLVHHTDAEREFSYDRESAVGRLTNTLDIARENDWVIVDMKRDWRRVFPERGQ